MKTIITLLILSFIFGTNGFAQKPLARIYYGNGGTKSEGLIRYSYGSDEVDFRKSKKEKWERLTTDDICCFVFSTGDSFAIVRNIRPYGLIRSTREKDFAKVIEAGKINLYKYYSANGAGSNRSVTEEWVIEKDGKCELVNEIKFAEQIKEYVGDYPALYDRIKKGQLDYRRAKDDTRAIVKFYNDWAKMIPK